MARNIQYQFLNSINQAFDGGGHDKHTDRHNGKHLDTVYSYSERSNLIELSSQIAKYIKENQPDIKKVLDIKPDMIQSFLNSKADNCHKETLGQYASRINKLEHVINDVYKGNINWYRDLITPISNLSHDKTRWIQMDRNDYKSILKRSYEAESKSKAIIAVELSGRFALRVSEGCKVQPRDINYNSMLMHVHESKGGRSRDIEIRKTDIEYLKSITEGKDPNKSIVVIKEDSVNKYLSRTEEALGIREKYKNADTGIHCIRKMVAQERYDEYRESGLSQKESINKVSQYLGHGINRYETMKEYILNIH